MRPLADLSEWDRLSVGNLSNFFNPFLRHFVGEALRCGGTVAVFERNGVVDGLFVAQETERIGTVFTRSPEIAEACYLARAPIAVFSEFPLGPKPELYHVYGVELEGWSEPWPFSHRIRAARPEDLPGLARLVRELQGPVDDRWLAPAEDSPDRCFVAEIRGRLVGAAWVTVCGALARLNALGVSPRFRGTGLGRDLWLARVLWARTAGARGAISEIAAANVVSQAIAERGGMRPVGRLYLGHRPRPAR